MRAIQVNEVHGQFRLTEVSVPEPGSGEVRIRVHACGVCGGDAIVREGLFPHPRFPCVPGHEVAGSIDKIGPDVAGWQQGDRVGVGFHGGHCFVCIACRAGDFVNCTSAGITGITSDGGWAEYMVASAHALARIPDAIPYVEAGPLMCAGLTTFNLLRNCGARAGDKVAVLGMGGLGHLALQFANKMGFHTIAIARGADRKDLAIQLGADLYIDSAASDAAVELRTIGGAHVVVAAASDTKAIASLIGGLGANGRIVVASDSLEPMPIRSHDLIFGKKSIQGWYSGHARDGEDAMAFAALRGVHPMVETYPLGEAETAYQRMSRARFRNVLLI